jgi:pimeloyl-ACP methyl ester carboxylesterase
MKQIIEYEHGKTLSYTDYGDRNGVPILIQHGLIASISDYHLFDRLIAAGRRVISIARPGYGESSPNCMNQISEWGAIISVLVDQLQLSHFDVLGLSSGAPYGYAIGYKLPRKTRDLYIFSGIPALYDDNVVEFWPYPINRHASIAELEKVAKELFFSNLTEEGLLRNDIRDSMMNNCFGVAQDLHLRSLSWGFRLTEITQTVYMEHCKSDTAVPFITAEMTAKMIPNCRLEIRESGEHFSEEALDNFIRKVILRQL